MTLDPSHYFHMVVFVNLAEKMEPNGEVMKKVMMLNPTSLKSEPTLQNFVSNERRLRSEKKSGNKTNKTSNNDNGKQRNNERKIVKTLII